MLETVLGPGQAVVRVAADINLDSLTRTEEKFDPDGQVLRTSTVNDESTDTTGAAGSGGVPGVTTIVGSETNTTAGASGVNSRNKKKVTNPQYEINRITSNMSQVAGGLKRVSAAVFVAARYEGAGAARKPIPRPPEELEKRQFWWNQVQNLIYPGLALVVFVIFWRALRRTSTAPVSEGVAMDPAPAAVTGHGRGHGRGNGPGVDVTEWQPPGAEIPGSVSVDVFNKIVRENPDNVTQALQSWLIRSNSNTLHH